MVHPTLAKAAVAATVLLSSPCEANSPHCEYNSLCSSSSGVAFVFNYRRTLPEQSPSPHITVRNLVEVEIAAVEQSQDDSTDCSNPWQYNGPNHQGNMAINRLAEKAARGDRTAAARAEDVLRGLEEQGAADKIRYRTTVSSKPTPSPSPSWRSEGPKVSWIGWKCRMNGCWSRMGRK